MSGECDTVESRKSEIRVKLHGHRDLYEIYPVETGIYFETYIEIMQAKLKHYLSGVEGHE